MCAIMSQKLMKQRVAGMTRGCRTELCKVNMKESQDQNETFEGRVAYRLPWLRDTCQFVLRGLARRLLFDSLLVSLNSQGASLVLIACQTRFKLKMRRDVAMADLIVQHTFQSVRGQSSVACFSCTPQSCGSVCQAAGN